MTQSIREKAISAMARAICQERYGDPDFDYGMNIPRWKGLIPDATAAFDAAISVLMEPDEAMLAEGNATPAMWTQTEQSRIIFQAMLKAATH